MPKVLDLTIKERRFIQNYVSSGNISQSALLAYDCKSNKTAYAVGKEVLEKPRIVNYLSCLLEKFGLTEERLVSDLSDIIEGGKNEKPTAKDAIKGIELALRLKGLLSVNKNFQVIEKETTLRAQLRGLSPEELQERLKKSVEEGQKLLQLDTKLE